MRQNSAICILLNRQMSEMKLKEDKSKWMTIVIQTSYVGILNAWCVQYINWYQYNIRHCMPICIQSLMPLVVLRDVERQGTQKGKNIRHCNCRRFLSGLGSYDLVICMLSSFLFFPNNLHRVILTKSIPLRKPILDKIFDCSFDRIVRKYEIKS